MTTGDDTVYVRRFAREARLGIAPELVTPRVLNRCFGVTKDARLLVIGDADIAWSRIFPEGGEDGRIVLGKAIATIDSLAAITGQPAEAPTLDTVGRTPISTHVQ